jgi:hypothetical protein
MANDGHVHVHRDEQISPELVLVDPELARRVRPFAVAGPAIAFRSPELAPVRRAPPKPAVTTPAPAAAPQKPAVTMPAPAAAPQKPAVTMPAPAAAPQKPAVTMPAPAVRPPNLVPARSSPPSLGKSTLTSVPAPRPRRAVLVRSLPALAALAVLGLAFLPPRDAPSLGRAPQAGARPLKKPAARPRATPTRIKPPTAPTITIAPPVGPAALSWRTRPGVDYYLVELFAGARLVHATSVRSSPVKVPRWLPPGRYEWRVFEGVGHPSERRTSRVVERGWFLTG